MKGSNKGQQALRIVTDYFKHFLEETKDIDFFGICAQMSFYMMMVFFPLFIFLINFVGAFASNYRKIIIDTVVTYMPDISADYVSRVLMRFNFDNPQNHIVLLAFSFVFTVIGFRNIIRGLNHRHHKYNRTFSPMALLLRSVGFTLFFNVSVLVMIVTVLFGSDVLERILSSFSIHFSIISFISHYLFILTSFLSIALFSGIYYLVSMEKLSFKHTLPGAILCTVGFNVGLRIFIYFANRSTQYVQVYGNFAGLFVLLVMVYWYSVLLNIGANMNSYYATTYNDQ
ncbi:MAG: YihY/virulence factor BrkB family protein [Eubacteriaceae bacterium]|nr:YihY/virulence factor BrkB family protein [Eubacteriaceae bacterium]